MLGRGPRFGSVFHLAWKEQGSVVSRLKDTTGVALEKEGWKCWTAELVARHGEVLAASQRPTTKIRSKGGRKEKKVGSAPSLSLECLHPAQESELSAPFFSSRSVQCRRGRCATYSTVLSMDRWITRQRSLLVRGPTRISQWSVDRLCLQAVVAACQRAIQRPTSDLSADAFPTTMG